MNELQGHAHKMLVSHDQPVTYTLPLDEHRLPMNPEIGSTIQIEFTGTIHCINCGRKTRKSYSQGYCYPCSQRLARCDMCIVRPHTCHFDAGTCREPDWALSHCFQDHYVYLANSSGLKVGITRQDQLPTRWIDQGATQALPLFRTRSRLIAGLLEKAIGAHVSDRTDWRRMLKGNAEAQDLQTEGDRLVELASADIAAILEAKTDSKTAELPFERLMDQAIVDIEFPVDRWPEKVRAHNLDKTPLVESTLEGIKGQYLILADGVLNVRKYTGYELIVRTG